MIRQCLAILILFGAEAAPAQDGEIDLSPVFSASRGFYRDPFDLTITAADQAAVKYTLDGSDPRTSSTAQRAATPLVLRIDPLDFSLRDRSPAVIVRAALANDPFVDVTTHTYLFINQIRHLSPDGEAPGALAKARETVSSLHESLSAAEVETFRAQSHHGMAVVLHAGAMTQWSVEDARLISCAMSAAIKWASIKCSAGRVVATPMAFMPPAKAASTP